MIYRLILLAMLAAVGATAATTPKTVTAERTSGELLWPTNLFSVNTNALVSALSDHFGTGGGVYGTHTNTDSYAALVADALSRTNQNCLLWDDFERTVTQSSAMGASIIGPNFTQYSTNWLAYTNSYLDGHDWVLEPVWNYYQYALLGGQLEADPNTIEAKVTWTALAASGTSDYMILATCPGDISQYATNRLEARWSVNSCAIYAFHPAESGGSRLLAGWTAHTSPTNTVNTYQFIVETNSPYAAILVNGTVIASTTDARIVDCSGPYLYAGNWHITWATPWMSAAVHSLSAWKPAVTPVTLGGTGITNALAFTTVGDGLTNSASTLKAALGAGTNIVLTTNAGLISINSSAAGGSAPVGTMVTNATGWTQYRVPKTTDATGTNYGPSGMVGDSTMTNMNVIGQFAADRLISSNAAYFGGSALGLSNAVTIQAGTLGSGAGGETGGSIISATGTWTSSNTPAFYLDITDTSGASTNELLNLTVNGAARLRLSKGGALIIGGQITCNPLISSSYAQLASAYSFNWASRSSIYSDSSTDVQIGVDSASSSEHQLKCADGSGTNIVSSSLKLTPGQPTGTAYSGNLLMQTYQPRTTSDATKSTLAITRHEYVAEPETISDGVASSIFTINLTTNNFVGGTIHYTIRATDGTDLQALSGMATFAAVNKAGTITCTISEATHAAAVTALSSGTLTDAWTITDDTNDVKILVEADSSLTTPTITIHYSIIMNGSDASVVSPSPAS